MADQYPLAARLMQRFAILYGWQKVKSQYLDDDNAIMAANESWQRLLEKQPIHVIRRVLQELETHPREWPPNMTEFAGLCREFNRVEQRENVALPAPKQVTEEGKRVLAQLKQVLESKRVK